MLHADVAREAIGDDDEVARQALGRIRSVSSETMRELRGTVKLLRNPNESQPEHWVISLANLSVLVEGAKVSNLAVDVHIEGEVAALPAMVDMAAYRIIQDLLTNIIRHAHATRVALGVVIDANELRLEITDNGRTDAGRSSQEVASPE